MRRSAFPTPPLTSPSHPFRRTARQDAEVLRLATAAVAHALLDPVRIEDDGAARHVWVLGRWAYRIDRSRRRVDLARLGPDGCVQVEHQAVDVGRPVRGWAWLYDYFLTPAVDEVYGTGTAATRCTDTRHGLKGVPLMRRLISAVRPLFDREALRLRVAEALALPPALLELATHVREYTHGAFVRNEDFNLAWRFEDTLARVRLESPCLVRPVALALRDDLIEAGPGAAGALKRLFLRAGLTEAGWRVIAKSPPRLFDRALEISRENAPTTIFYVAKLVSELRLPFVPPPRFLALVWDLATVLRGWRTMSFDPHWDRLCPPWFARAAAMEYERRRGDARALGAFRREFLDAEAWVHRAEPRPDANQRRAGWSWIMRKQQAWHARKRVWADDRYEWAAPPLPAEVEGCAVRALTGLLALWDEAVAMRHCIYDLAHVYATGSSLALSLTEKTGRRRRATASLRYSEELRRWHVENVRGFANQPADGLFRRAAKALAAYCCDWQSPQFTEFLRELEEMPPPESLQRIGLGDLETPIETLLDELTDGVRRDEPEVA